MIQDVLIQIEQTNVPTHDSFDQHIHISGLENGWR